MTWSVIAQLKIAMTFWLLWSETIMHVLSYVYVSNGKSLHSNGTQHTRTSKKISSRNDNSHVQWCISDVWFWENNMDTDGSLSIDYSVVVDATVFIVVNWICLGFSSWCPGPCCYTWSVANNVVSTTTSPATRYQFYNNNVNPTCPAESGLNHSAGRCCRTSPM